MRYHDSVSCLTSALFFLATGLSALGGEPGIQLAASPGQVEVFFEAVSTNDYRIWQGDSLTNLLPVETISGVSGVVSREYAITGTAGFFRLEQMPVIQPLAGFGTISGRAFVLHEELTNAAPALFSNSLDFGVDPFNPGVDDALLTAGGRAILDSDSSGGGVYLSKVFAFEVLARAEGAALLKLGDEITYADPGGKKADFMVEIRGVKIGVTVTRAFAYPPGNPYTIPMAESLLTSKLNDILVSNTNVISADAWSKQILSVIAYDPSYLDCVRAAWDNLPPAVKADTIVYVTFTSGSDSFLY